MSKRKPTYIDNVEKKIQFEETLMGLLKQKFAVMKMRSRVRSMMHYSIAVGDHDCTYAYSHKLKYLDSKLESLNRRIDSVSNR